MLDEMPFQRLVEWMAFDQLDPIGGLRGDWQAASICSVIANTAAAKSGSRKRFNTKDFLLEFGAERKKAEGPEEPRQSWQQQKMIAMMFAAASKADQEKAAKRRRKR